MITQIYDVMLVDFSGILPFKLEKREILSRQEKISEQNLSTFLTELEKNAGETFAYVGSDLLETRLFHRVMLKDGLLEILIGTPITLLAHYKEETKAKKFKESLKKTLKKMIPEHLVSLVEESIEIKKIEKKLETGNNQFNKLGRVNN